MDKLRKYKHPIQNFWWEPASGKVLNKGWRCNSVIEHLPSVCKDLGSIPSNTNKQTKAKKRKGQLLHISSEPKSNTFHPCPPG
jgi:hypothetical protein